MLGIEQEVSRQAREVAKDERELRLETERKLAVKDTEVKDSARMAAVELVESEYSLLSGAVEAGDLSTCNQHLAAKLGVLPRPTALKCRPPSRFVPACPLRLSHHVASHELISRIFVRRCYSETVLEALDAAQTEKSYLRSILEATQARAAVI